MQECSDDGEPDAVVRVEEVDDDGQDEAREVIDDELFGHLQQEKEAMNQEHNSVILKLDGSISEKEKLLAAIKSSQNQM